MRKETRVHSDQNPLTQTEDDMVEFEEMNHTKLQEKKNEKFAYMGLFEWGFVATEGALDRSIH